MIIEGFVDRGIAGLVKVNISGPVKRRYSEEIENGGIPLIYSNHQAHVDGIGHGVLIEELKKVRPQYPKGFAMPVAKSLVTGDQSEGLKLFYDLFDRTLTNMGLIRLPVTRVKDVERFKFSRRYLAAEMLPFRRLIDNGYGIAFFPEGTVEGGRHPKDQDSENIYGMQKINEEPFTSFYQLVSRSGEKINRRPFFIPVGVHGGYRIQQSPENGIPNATALGVRSLIEAALGILPETQIEVVMGMPFNINEVSSGLGPNWQDLERDRINAYFMSRILPLIPRRAWGDYGRRIYSEAIELSGAS